MKVSSFKIIIIILVLSLIGIFLIPKLSIQLNPSDRDQNIEVSYYWTNASSYAVEQQITSILESGLSRLRGLQKVNSRSSKGYGKITLQFNEHTSMDVARFEAATIIRQLYPNLPERTTYPVIRLNKPDEQNEETALLTYSIISTAPPFKIHETIKNLIKPVLNGIPGVEKIQIYGANPKEWVVHYDNEMLLQLGIDKELIINSIQGYFQRNSLGEVFYKNKLLTLNIISSSEEITWNIPIKRIGNRVIYLSDIAEVKEQEQESRSYYRINGKNAMNLVVYAQNRANTLTLSEVVSKELNNLQKSLPVNYSIKKIYDSTDYLKVELSKIYKRSIYTISILLLFILTISKSLRYLFITILSIGANLCIAFSFYYLFRVDIQLYSMAGITISLGIIIDNTIVMTDHIRSQKNIKVFKAILASTITTIGALSIIYFLDENLKNNFIDFACVIIINLSVSLFVAHFFVPALVKKFRLKRKSLKGKPNNYFYRNYICFIPFALRYKKLFIVAIILLFGTPFFMLPTKLDKNDTWYKKFYNNTLGNEWYTENIRPHIDKYLGGTFRLFSYYVFENALYADEQETKLYVVGSMEKGATVHQMNEVFIRLENFLVHFPEIKNFTTNVYSGDYASMEITFNVPYDESGFPFLLKSNLTQKVLDYGGMAWKIYGVGNAYSSGGSAAEPINFKVEAKGYNYDELNSLADTLKNKLLKHPRIQNVIVRENSLIQRRTSFQYTLLLDKEKLNLYNISPVRLYNNLSDITYSTHDHLALNIKGSYMPIRFQAKEAKTFDVWHIQNTMLRNKESSYNLKQTAFIEKQKEEENIYKENQEYVRLIEFQYIGSEKMGKVFLDEKLDELRQLLPLGYSFEEKPINWSFAQDKENNYFLLLLLILATTYVICAVLFESLTQPFIIMSVIPISFIGVFISFYIFDFNFDQGGMASFVLLSGLTVNSSIFVLNDFNILKKEISEKPSYMLFILAFQQKIFPILLTILSTALGFVPFVIEGQNEIFWFALGVGTIGGLVFSLIAILIYLPIFTLKSP